MEDWVDALAEIQSEGASPSAVVAPPSAAVAPPEIEKISSEEKLHKRSSSAPPEGSKEKVLSPEDRAVRDKYYRIKKMMKKNAKIGIYCDAFKLRGWEGEEDDWKEGDPIPGGVVADRVARWLRKRGYHVRKVCECNESGCKCFEEDPEQLWEGYSPVPSVTLIVRDPTAPEGQ